MKLEEKICQEDQLSERLSQLARPLVMTNGVFDLLHRGHVNYLNRAAELGASLLVAVNSDRSARMLGKGSNRPLNAELDRAYVLAGLASVDMVTFFDTRTPVGLIQNVHPDIYVKGGDYDMESLEETRIVRSWGGQAMAIPFVGGFSTTALVQRILMPVRKGAILEIDVVINRDKAYISQWGDFELVPGAIEGMKLLEAAGYALLVLIDQSAWPQGYYKEEKYQSLTKRMLETLSQQGVTVAGVYHYPHNPNRTVSELSMDFNYGKLAPDLLLQAASELRLSMHDSLLVGERASNIHVAYTAGLGKAYWVCKSSSKSSAECVQADGHFDNLMECAKYLALNYQKEIST